MNYPLISEYIEAIKSAEDNFKELNYLRPVLCEDGTPVMTSGNFAVVFKMKDERDGKFYAVKCFTKEQEGRAEAYREITKELKKVSSPYLVSIRYLEKELFVDTGQTTETEFPVLLMDWVDGITLDKYILQNLSDTKLLQDMTYRFSRMAKWLLSQNFAHGDLKPDNILIKRNCQIVLVDYDGMYVPAMKGQKALEIGRPNFWHPRRAEEEFDVNIDNFSIVVILLSLKAISLKPKLFSSFVGSDRLLFCEKDYQVINENKILPLLNSVLYDRDVATLLGTFLLLLYNNMPSSLSSIIDIQQIYSDNTKKYSESQLKEKLLHFLSSIDIYPPKIVYLIPDLFNKDIRNYWLPQHIWRKFSVSPVFWNQDDYKSMYSWSKDFDSVFYSVDGEFSKKSRYNSFAIRYSSDLKPNLHYLVNYMFDILNEMGVLVYFVDNFDKLLEMCRDKYHYELDKNNLPF